MAASTYALVIPKVLAHEGGYVNHPKDPGGATNLGVTQATYDAFRAARNLPRRSVKGITEDEVHTIYRRNYWDALHGDDLPAGTDYATFDGGVNSGTSRAARWLQQVVSAPVDGRIGPVTVQTVAAYAPGQAALVKAYCGTRLAFMQGLRIWQTFRKGWARRVAEVEAYGVKLALAAVPGTTPAVVKTELDHAAADARAEAKKDAGKAGTAAVADAVATQGETIAEATLPPAAAADPAFLKFVVVATAAALAVAAAVFAWRWWINRARARAYAEEARRP